MSIATILKNCVLVKYLHIWMNNICAYNMLKYCTEQTVIHSLLIHLFLNRMIHISTSLEEYALFLFVTETRLQDPTKLLHFSQKKPLWDFLLLNRIHEWKLTENLSARLI